MTLNLGGWIHNFTVTDTQTHKDGYTIYKITSIVFPRSVPQALTCLVVWKRFHDVKRLYRELSRRHKSLQLPGSVPIPTDSSFFKRFDAEIIQKRKEYILELLDFAAQHPALYKCNVFAQFFSDIESPTVSASPLHKLFVEKQNRLGSCNELQSKCNEDGIAEICDKLDLLYDPLSAGGITPTDSTRNKSNQIINSEQNVANADNNQILLKTSTAEATQKEGKQDYTSMLTPMASVESDDSDYIYEAALEFSHAVQAEVNLEYQEAYDRYKCGIELLLIGSKDDANDERKFIAKAKIAKYLAHSDEIYTRFLKHPEFSKKLQFQLSLDIVDKNTQSIERPWNQLAKYKVLKILGNRVMQVQCITEPQQQTCVMKGVEKPANNSPTQSIFLPQQVPYMVDLLAYFQSEEKIFLLLRQAEGGLLIDYIKSYTPGASKSTNYEHLFPKDVGSAAANHSESMVEKEIEEEEKEAAAIATAAKTNDCSELLHNSQQLLQSVSNTLREVKPLHQQPTSPRFMLKCPSKQSATRHIPESCLRQWACELAVAIHSLHEKGIILSDLHMDNILLGAKGQLLLTYFYQNEGLRTDDNYTHKALCHTALDGHFVAPERPLTLKSDWWSYGVVLYQLLVGVPFDYTHPGQIDIYGCVQYLDNVQISDNARDLLEKLLQLHPENRMDYDKLQQHAFFDGINWQKVLENGLTANSSCSSNKKVTSL